MCLFVNHLLLTPTGPPNPRQDDRDHHARGEHLRPQVVRAEAPARLHRQGHREGRPRRLPPPRRPHQQGQVPEEAQARL